MIDEEIITVEDDEIKNWWKKQNLFLIDETVEELEEDWWRDIGGEG